MRQFFKLLLVFIAVIGLTGSMAFANTYTDHVKIAPNGKGDLLLFPWYSASPSTGWQTKLTVTNTDQIYSTVAHVAVKEYVNSYEFDFLIYLSPADVWTGTLMYDATSNKVALVSSDDSMYNGVSWGSANSPIKLMIPNAPVTLGSTTFTPDYTFGYVDITEITSFITPGKTAAGIPYGYGVPVAKSDILNYYNNVVYNNPAFYLPTAFPTRNILSGKMDVMSSSTGLVASLNPTVLANYHNEQLINGGLTYNIGTPVPPYNVGSYSNNSLAEVEAVLAKDMVAMPYINSAAGTAFHIFSFPTKQNALSLTKNAIISPFFADNYAKDSKVIYFPEVYDLSEVKPTFFPPIVSPAVYNPPKMPYEVNVIAVSSAQMDSDTGTGALANIFTQPEGWANYHFVQSVNPIGYQATFITDVTSSSTGSYSNIGKYSAITYTGAPVICTYLYMDAAGHFTANYPSWTDGTVTGDGTVANPGNQLIDYMYTNLLYVN